MNGFNSVRVEWPNHGSVLGENMWKMFTEKTRLMEHQLTFESRVLDVHFVIFGALCESFSPDKVFLDDNADQKNDRSKVSFSINGVSVETLNCFLEFVYRGKTVLAADSLKTFLMLVLQARVRDLDQLHVQFCDDKAELSAAGDHVSVDNKSTDSPQNDSFLSDYLDSFSAHSEEDWNKLDLDSFVFTLLKDEAVTNKILDDLASSSLKKTTESVDLNILDLPQKETQSCTFHVNDILRCCSCLLKEHRQIFTITFSNSESKVTETLRVSNICNFCSVKSPISVTAERVRAKEEAHSFLNTGNYISQHTEDEVKFLGSYSKETSTGLSNFCSEIETKVRINCMLCKHSANSEISLARHLTTVHSNNMALLEPKLDCKVCKHSANSEISLARHMTSAHSNNTALLEPKLNCMMCKHSANSKISLARHMTTAHSNNMALLEPKLICLVCKHSANSEISLARHLTTAHSNNMALLELKLDCKVCKYSTGSKILLAIHMTTAHSILGLLEPKLEKTNTFSEAEKNAGRKKYRCDVCDHKSCNYFEFKCHSFQHQRRPPFECKDCGMKFSIKVLLFQHILKKHCESNDVFKCSHCNFRTPWKIRIDRHAKCCRKSIKNPELRNCVVKLESYTDLKILKRSEF